LSQKWGTIEEDFCGWFVSTPLGGDEPVFETAVFTRNKVLLTAVVATSTGNATVVFVGTSTGHLIKVRTYVAIATVNTFAEVVID
jgi:plexin A